MSTSQIAGIALIFAGLVDIALGLLIVAPRVPDEGRRRIVQIAFTLGAAALIALGTAFLTGALGFAAPSAREA